MKNKKGNNIRYSKGIIIISLLLFAVMIIRVSQLGLSKEVDGVNLKELASKRTTRTETLAAKRGNIYSADGDILAQNVASYKIIAYLDEKRTTNKDKPQHVVDKEKTATELAPILGMEKDEILRYLNKENVYQTEFGTRGKNLTELTKQKIDLLKLPGIDFIESYKRYYPKGDFASYTIGYAKTNIDDENQNEEIIGEMGIEKQYNSLLKGEDGYKTYQKDLRGYQIANTDIWEKDAVEGKDIYLTIESNVQFFIEQALDNADVDYDFEWFTMTVLDAKTGAVLGTATSPSFDPNIRNITNYLDTFVAAPYEPGSTMKTFTYMAALENGVYNGTDTYKSGTYVTKDGTEIGDWNRAGWGMLTYDKGYAMSSNVAIINLIKDRMDSMMLRQYFKKLGFGKKTGISLPNESAGDISFKYETEIYNAGFGQGITTTPIQNVQAMTPLTNDGILLKPYIVSKIIDSKTGEVILENKRKENERVASTTTVQKMIQLMDDCVNGAGNTGSGYKISSGELIGKTGTAQIANEHGGGYLNGKEDIISSFSGVYPKSDPQYIIYASVKRPTNGSQKPVSNAVKELVENLSKYYGTESKNEETETIKEFKLANYVNKKIETIKPALDINGVNYSIIGTGYKVIKQYPEKNDIITSKDTLYLITNDQNLGIPNVVGLSGKVASNLLEQLGVKVILNGVGYVTEQSIVETTPITPGLEITLTLFPKFTS